jgi:DNA-binding transcriptional LysR family regulator
MPYSFDWDDLRFFLAVARSGSLSGAARELRVDPGTVSRRVSAMESALGARCFERRPDGYPLTEQGAHLLKFAQRIENEIAALDHALDASDRMIEGVVALTASESISTPFVVPVLAELRTRHPGIRIELTADNRVLSLSRREIDIALRMARSEEDELLSRRIGTLSYGIFASSDYLSRAGRPSSKDDLGRHALIDWLQDYPRAPTAVWLREITALHPPVLKVNSVHDRRRAAELGIGIALLPLLVARDSRLQQVLCEVEVPPLEIWLLAHPEVARIPRVRTVMDFLAEKASLNAPAFAGE